MENTNLEQSTALEQGDQFNQFDQDFIDAEIKDGIATFIIFFLAISFIAYVFNAVIAR